MPLPIGVRMYPSPHRLTPILRRFMVGPTGQALKQVTDRFRPTWRWYLIGGVITDLAAEQWLNRPAVIRDIDILLTGVRRPSDIQRQLSRFNPRRNRHGGWKLKLPSGLNIDCWRVENHVPWRRPHPTSIPTTLPQCSIGLTAVAWDPRRDRLFDAGCLPSLTTRTFDLQRPLGPNRIGVNDLAYVLMTALKYRWMLRVGMCAADALDQAQRKTHRWRAIEQLFVQRYVEKQRGSRSRAHQDFQRLLQHIAATRVLAPLMLDLARPLRPGECDSDLSR